MHLPTDVLAGLGLGAFTALIAGPIGLPLLAGLVRLVARTPLRRLVEAGSIASVPDPAV